MLKSPRFLIYTVFLILLGCTSEQAATIQSGSGYQYRRGFPEVTMSAIGIFDEDGIPGINIAADIVYGSLIYKNVDTEFVADVTIDIQIVRTDRTEQPPINRNFQFSVKGANNSVTNSQDVITFQERFPVPPGEYTINLMVTDEQSKKNTTRATTTQLPDPDSPQILLTDINMLGKVDTSTTPQYFPITTYDVPGRVDTLLFQYQVTKNSPDSRLDVQMKLMSFRIDSLPARSMYLRDYSTSEMGYKGVETRNPTIIDTQTRTLQYETGSILIEYPFPKLARGAYRFEITVTGDGLDEPLVSIRDFSVKSPYYPSLRTVRELAEPLIYLMDDRKHRRMMEIQDPDSLKYEIDYFWLDNIENAAKAKSVLEMYYLRVEEANKQFPHFKAGWMTDPGMIYILFGPPWDVEVRLDEMRWVYGNNPNDPSRVFFFKRTRVAAREYPFEIYVLRRSSYYFDVLNSKIQDWLNGLVLTRDL